MNKEKLTPIHPGDILKTELLEANNLTTEKLAENIGVAKEIINDLLNEKGSITPDLALRLSIYFEISPEFFLNLQQRYDLKVLKNEQETQLRKIIHPYHPQEQREHAKR